MRTILPRTRYDLGLNRKFGAAGPRRGGSGSSSGGGGSAGNLSGTGTPEGAVTGDPGFSFWQTDTQRLWIKNTGTGNTGWVFQTKHTSGSGSPEGVIVGRPGDTFVDATNDTKYQKKTGTDTNTGWI